MKILFSTGEVLGDRVAEQLLPLFKQGIEVKKFKRKITSEVDIFDNLLKIKDYLKHLKEIRSSIKKWKPDIFVPIAFSSFHEFLIPRIREYVKKIVYISPPQIWAWREKRDGIREYVDAYIVFYPFEYSFMKERNYNVHYFGHPLITPVHKFEGSREYEVCLLPGSRYRFSRRNLLYMLNIVKELNIKKYTIFSPFYRKDFNTLEEAITHSKIVISSGGFVSLESVLHGTPTIIAIRLTSLSYKIFKRMKKTEYISLVNNILKKEVIKEFINAPIKDVASYIKNVKYEERKFQEISKNLISILYREDTKERIVEFIESMA